MRSSSSIPMTTLEPGASSSFWFEKKEFDPSTKVDQNIFDDAPNDTTSAPPPASAERIASDDSVWRFPSADLMRSSADLLRSSDFRFPSTESTLSCANRGDLNFQSLIAASEVSRTASDALPSDALQRATSSQVFQNIIASLASEKPSEETAQRYSSIDLLNKYFLASSSSTPAASNEAAQRSSGIDLIKNVSAPSIPEVRPFQPADQVKKEETKVTAKAPSKHMYVPPSSKRRENRVYVDEISSMDVLSGRGGKSNHHFGNKKYRQVVSEMKQRYRGISAKTAKTDVSRQIVDHVLEYGGRFLRKDASNGRYYIMTHDEARKKTSQALRETKILKWTVGSAKETSTQAITA